VIVLSANALVQGVINGFILGWIYVLMAMGLALIVSIMNIMQFAHGEIYMLGAYLVYYFTVVAGLNPWLSMLLSMVMVGLLGLFLERYFFRPLTGAFLQPVCVAIGLMLIIQTSVVLGFGLSEKSIPDILPGVFHILGKPVSKDRIIALGISITLTVLLYLFLTKSRYGQAIIAAAQNREGAVLQGINPDRLSALVMMIGSALAAVGGALAGGIFFINPFMGSAALMKGIAIIVLGGMGSLSGVIIGGMILGFADGLIPLIFGSAPGAVVPLLVIIVILIIKPQGLFGHE